MLNTQKSKLYIKLQLQKTKDKTKNVTFNLKQKILHIWLKLSICVPIWPFKSLVITDDYYYS
jgi:hypothetical protein